MIGGALTSSIGWQWCFWINLPFGGLTLPCLAILLDLHNPKTPFIAGLRAIDFPGAITITGATIMLLLGLQFGGVSYPWDSAIVICLIVAGGVTFGLFGVLQYVNRSGVRIIPFRVFSRPTNIAALVVCFCHGFVFFGCLYYLSMYLQFSLDQGPIYAGLWLLAAAVPLSCASIATGLITKKTGRYREIISISALVMTLGCGLLIDLPAHQSWPRIVFYEMILAAGLGPLFQGPLVAVQSQVPPEDAATATSACSFLRMIGASISLVAGQVLLSNHLQNKSANLLAAGIPDEVVAKILKKFIALGNDETAMLTTQQQQLVRRTFNDGMHNIWILDTALSALAFLCSLFIQHKALSGDNTIGAPAGTQSTQELARIESSIPSGAQSPALSHYDGNTEQKQEEHNFI